MRTASCIGPAHATAYAVYLHGMDGVSPSGQEMQNRAILASMASKLSMRVALPRATARCPNQPSSICWGWTFDEREVHEGATTIDAAARSCFGEKAFALIGFSNGGYLLTKMLRSCVLPSTLPRVTQLVTSGSTMMKEPLEREPSSLAGCGKLTMLIGDKDEFNFDPTGTLLHGLQRKGADVREVRFEGTHLLSEEPLMRVLSSF
ncbi:MAG: hypothetical protein KF819_41150 [Labilithrix sp.]|nr:hypothetical protein [Labilithrix sp.]